MAVEGETRKRAVEAIDKLGLRRTMWVLRRDGIVFGEDGVMITRARRLNGEGFELQVSESDGLGRSVVSSTRRHWKTFV